MIRKGKNDKKKKNLRSEGADFLFNDCNGHILRNEKNGRK